MKTLLNVASGPNVLPPRCTFGTSEEFLVWNIDKEISAEVLKSHAQVLEADATKSLRFQTDEVAVVLSVSPYGFPVINTETMRVLQSGGGIIVMGSKRNPYVNHKVAQTKELSDELIPLAAGDEPVWDQIVAFLSDQANYVSKKSGGVEETRIDTVRIWRKK